MSNGTDLRCRRQCAAAFVSLFASGGTLICCALPALLVSIGAGATLAGLVGAIPQVVWFPEHKTAVFGVAGLMLAIAGAMHWNARSLPCPAGARLAAACLNSRKASAWVYWFSVAMLAVGVFFAFIALLTLSP